MLKPVKHGAELIREIESSISAEPILWALGHTGFAVRFATLTFYINPCFSDIPGSTRLTAAPLQGSEVHNADLILATDGHPADLDPGSILPMLESSKGAKLVLPRAIEAETTAQGIPANRTAPTDSNLKIEYFRDSLWTRIYAIPSARPAVDPAPTSGHRSLGYLLRFGRWTVFHAGDCTPYEDLAARLRPFNVNIALLPIGGKNFSVDEAAQLAADIGATWIVPTRYGTFLEEASGGKAGGEEDIETAFVTHMLGHCPEQRFRTLECGQMWAVPED